MANHQKKPVANRHKGCGLCKSHKQVGNSVEALKAKYRHIKGTQLVYDADQ